MCISLCLTTSHRCLFLSFPLSFSFFLFSSRFSPFESENYFSLHVTIHSYTINQHFSLFQYVFVHWSVFLKRKSFPQVYKAGYWLIQGKLGSLCSVFPSLTFLLLEMFTIISAEMFTSSTTLLTFYALSRYRYYVMHPLFFPLLAIFQVTRKKDKSQLKYRALVKQTQIKKGYSGLKDSYTSSHQ